MCRFEQLNDSWISMFKQCLFLLSTCRWKLATINSLHTQTKRTGLLTYSRYINKLIKHLLNAPTVPEIWLIAELTTHEPADDTFLCFWHHLFYFLLFLFGGGGTAGSDRTWRHSRATPLENKSLDSKI